MVDHALHDSGRGRSPPRNHRPASSAVPRPRAEDFLLEWAQFAAYLAAAGFAACTAYRLAHAKQRGLAVLSAVFACCCSQPARRSRGGRVCLRLAPRRSWPRSTVKASSMFTTLLRRKASSTSRWRRSAFYALVAPWAARRPSLLIPPAALSSALLAAFTYTVPRAHASPLFFSAARYVS